MAMKGLLSSRYRPISLAGPAADALMRRLQLRAEEMAGILLESGESVGDPIELDGAARALERQMAVPGPVGPLEHQERAFDRGDLLDVILDIGAAAQEAQIAALLVPG